MAGFADRMRGVQRIYLDLRTEIVVRDRTEMMTGAVFMGLVAISLVPVLLTRYPESADYLNHFGRLFILTVPNAHPVHALYQPTWRLMPDLGLDLLVLGLFKVLPLEVAMKSAWVLTFLSLAGAIAFLHWELRRRASLGLLLSSICLFNFPLTSGFMSFTLGLAAALATFALWFRFGNQANPSSTVMLNLTSTLIVIIHAAALPTLGLTIVALHALRAPWRPVAIIRRAVAASCGFVAPLCLLRFMESPASQWHFPDDVKFALWDKPELLLAPVFTGVTVADAVGLATLLAAPYLILRHGGRFDRRLLGPLVAWAVVLLILPSAIGRATVIDRRLSLFPVLLFLAGLDAPSTRRHRMIGAVVAAAIFIRLAFITPAWIDYNNAIVGFRSIAGLIPPRAKVLIAEAAASDEKCDEPWRWPPFFHHIPVLLLIDRNAFVPTMFSAPGMQPIRVTEDYREIADPGANVVPWYVLKMAETAEGRSSISAQFRSGPWRPYFLGWQDTYDYLVTLKINCASDIPPDPHLMPLAKGGVFELYQITHVR